MSYSYHENAKEWFREDGGDALISTFSLPLSPGFAGSQPSLKVQGISY